MRKVQQIFFINRVPPLRIKGEVKKRLVEIKIFMEMAEAILPLLLLLLVALVLASISVVIVI